MRCDVMYAASETFNYTGYLHHITLPLFTFIEQLANIGSKKKRHLTWFNRFWLIKDLCLRLTFYENCSIAHQRDRNTALSLSPTWSSKGDEKASPSPLCRSIIEMEWLSKMCTACLSFLTRHTRVPHMVDLHENTVIAFGGKKLFLASSKYYLFK